MVSISLIWQWFDLSRIEHSLCDANSWGTFSHVYPPNNGIFVSATASDVLQSSHCQWRRPPDWKWPDRQLQDAHAGQTHGLGPEEPSQEKEKNNREQCEYTFAPNFTCCFCSTVKKSLRIFAQMLTVTDKLIVTLKSWINIVWHGPIQGQIYGPSIRTMDFSSPVAYTQGDGFTWQKRRVYLLCDAVPFTNPQLLIGFSRKTELPREYILLMNQAHDESVTRRQSLRLLLTPIAFGIAGTFPSLCPR